MQTPIFRGYITKKNAKSYDLTFNIWCTSCTHIRTFLRFHGFPESDRFRTFLIIKGDEDLIIVEIDGIDEGVHQCLPLLRLSHVQLAEAEQPEPDELFFHLRFFFASRSSAMRACSSFRCSSRASNRSFVELVRMPIWIAFSILVMPVSVSFNCFS